MPISKVVNIGYTGESDFTFVFEDEGHTLGRALHSIISTYPDVEYAAYNVPHPSESKMHFRIQMRKGRAIDGLQRGLEDLAMLCQHTLTTFDKALAEWQAAST